MRQQVLVTSVSIVNNLSSANAMEPATKAEGKRRPNWSEEEKLVLVEEVNKRQERVSAKFKGCGTIKGTKLKEQAWAEIAQVLNMKSSLVKRTVEEVKKQYANIKQRAKDKADAIRRPKTGGGPKPPSPSLPEAKVLEDLADRPTLQGLIDGLDSEGILLTEFGGATDSSVLATDSSVLATNFTCVPAEQGCGFATTRIQNCPLPLDVTIDSQGILQIPVECPKAKATKCSKRKYHEEEISVLQVEKEKFIVEIEKLKNEAKYFQVKAEVEELKREKLQLELNLLKCRNEQ